MFFSRIYFNQIHCWLLHFLYFFSYYIFTHCDFKSLTTRIFLAILVSLYISKRGYDKKSLSLSGALAATGVGFITTLANLSSFVCLLTFFVTSSFFTKWKSERKRLLEENFKEGEIFKICKVCMNWIFSTFFFKKNLILCTI